MPISARRFPCGQDACSGDFGVRTPRHRQCVLRCSAEVGRRFTRATRDRSSPEFADYLLEIAEHYLAVDTIHLGMDNLSLHTRKALVERFGEKARGWLWDRFIVHYTPNTAAD